MTEPIYGNHTLTYPVTGPDRVNCCYQRRHIGFTIRLVIASLIALLFLSFFSFYPVDAADDCANLHDVNILFIIDYSSSMEGWKSDLARQFGLGVLDALASAGHLKRAGIVPFPNTDYLPVTNENIPSVRSVIRELPSNGGGTPLYDAIVWGANQLKNLDAPGRKILVVITDGEDTSSVLNDYTRAAFALAQTNAWRYLVFVGNESDSGENVLSTLAGFTGSGFRLAGSGMATALIDEVIGAACQTGGESMEESNAGFTISDPELHLGIEGDSITFEALAPHDGWSYGYYFTKPDHTRFYRNGRSQTLTFTDEQFRHGENWKVELYVTVAGIEKGHYAKSFKVIGSPPGVPRMTFNGSYIEQINLHCGPSAPEPLGCTRGMSASQVLRAECFGSSDPDGGSTTIQLGISQAPLRASHRAGELWTPTSEWGNAVSFSFVTTENDIGEWALKCSVVDNEGQEQSVIFPFSVENIPPRPERYGSNVTALEKLTVSTRNKDDVDGGPLTFIWRVVAAPERDGTSYHVGDSWNTQTVSFETTDKDIGSWTFELTAEDNEGAKTVETIIILVYNIPPQIQLSGNSVDALQKLVVSASPKDDIDGGPLTFTWRVVAAPERDGTSYHVGDSWNTQEVSFDTTDKDIGSWTFECTAEDDEKTTDIKKITIEVHNLPPQIDLIPHADTIKIGTSVLLKTTIIEDTDGGELSFRWDIVQAPQLSSSRTVQEGYASGLGAAGASLSFDTTLSDAGTWIFRLVATDDDNAQDSEKSQEVIILVDGPPTATISGEGIHDTVLPIVLDGAGSVDPDSPCPEEPQRCHITLAGKPVTAISPGLSYSWFLMDVPSELAGSYPMGSVDEIFGVFAHGEKLEISSDSLSSGKWTFRLEVQDGEGNTDAAESQISLIDQHSPPKAAVSSPEYYTVDDLGAVSQDIFLSALGSFDPDNAFNPENESEGDVSSLGITEYQWELIEVPANCTPPPVNSGPSSYLVMLYAAGTAIEPACLGLWRIRVTVTDDDSPSLTNSVETLIGIGNCPQFLCIDYPTEANPLDIEFTDNADIFVYYHLDSVLLAPELLGGALAQLDVYYNDDLTTPVYTARELNVLASDRGGQLVFHWNGYTNDFQRLREGRYTLRIILISLVDAMSGPVLGTSTEVNAIWIATAEPRILETSDKYISFRDLDQESVQINFDYAVEGTATPDSLRFTVYDDSDQVVFQESSTPGSQPSIRWDGRSAGATIPPGEYTARLEAYRHGTVLGSSASYSFFVIFVGLSADLNRDGIYGESDSDEHTAPGMLIFVNSDDDDQNGREDHLDDGTSAENDLVDVKIDGAPGTLDAGKLILEVVQGSDRIKVWASPHKGAGELLLDSLINEREWIIGRDIRSLDEWPNKLYIEAISSRSAIGDVSLSLRYEINGKVLSSDELVITNITSRDIALFETARPENEAFVYKSEANPASVLSETSPVTRTRTLLFIHDCPTVGNETTGTSSVRLGFASQARLMYRYDRLEPNIAANVASGTVGSGPAVTTLLYNDDTEGDTNPDMRLLVGIDMDQSGTLEDAEARIQFFLHLVTDDNYSQSIGEVTKLIDGPLIDMSDALFRHFATGTFSGTEPRFVPMVVPGGIVVGSHGDISFRHKFGHNFGAWFTGTGDYSAMVPLFLYPLGSAGSELASRTNDLTGSDVPSAGYRSGIVWFITHDERFKYQSIDSLFQSLGGGPIGTTYVITFPNLGIDMNLGIFVAGVGRVTAEGSLVVDLTRTDSTEYELHHVRALLTIEDLFDFDYFAGGLAGWTGQNPNGASIQAGFGKCGNASEVGHVFVTRIETDRTFLEDSPGTPIGPITIKIRPQ